MWTTFLLTLAAAAAVVPATSAALPDDLQDRLLAVKKDWGNPPFLSSWSPSTPPCSWPGVTCSGAGDVTALFLDNYGITGQFPSSLCVHLPNLTALNLSWNYLPGPFPSAALSGCAALAVVDLSDNCFVGPLPANLGEVLPAGLTFLSLAGNSFSGSVPPSIGRLRKLRSLFLDNNLFDGSYPPELGDLADLVNLTLANNSFVRAPIPLEFGNLTKLAFLWMSNMNAIGPVPATLAEMTSLEHLDLSMNRINGSVQPWIWRLPRLHVLYMYANLLSGELEVDDGSIGATELKEIDLSINKLNGSIPAQFAGLKNLSVLLMYMNQLTGGIPAGIGGLPELIDIRLFNNQLSGPLPPDLGKYSKLKNLEVSLNELSGELPPFLCANKALTSVVVFGNQLSGEISESLAECGTLVSIQLYNNAFSGEFPQSIWSTMKGLKLVLIHENAFTGTLPAVLPQNLTLLEISNNRFSGNVPSTAQQLTVFTASNNSFLGELPNSITTGMPELAELNLSGNQIAGAIPVGIGSLKLLRSLDLSSNHLSGDIPPTIGSLPVLTSLNLSDNQLTGVIPPEFNDLKLSILDLSGNKLTGAIPESLQNGAYKNSFRSNPGLCAQPNLFPYAPPCSVPPGSQHKLSSALQVIVLVLASLAVFCMAAVAVLLLRKRRRAGDNGDIPSWKLTSFHAIDFIESDVVRGVSDENIIGAGGCGVVYRVTLGDRTVVAVKRICNGRRVEEKLEKEFFAEVKILGEIRHANIIKLLCCISSTDSKMLVYEFMENGSLDRWLHHRERISDDCPVLDWPTRLRIAVDAAKGLCYMHHGCSPPIVHRDVKSSNILLDMELHAKVADFGLARILARAGEPESVSTVGGTFGYMAPECGYLLKVNEKMDVYSFGVVLLELTTGRVANDDREDCCLAEWAWRHVQNGGKVADAVDSHLSVGGYSEDIEAVFKLGLNCTGREASARPTMRDVVHILLRCAGCSPRLDAVYRNEYDEAPLLLVPRTGSCRKSLMDAECDDGHDNDDSVNFLVRVV